VGKGRMHIKMKRGIQGECNQSREVRSIRGCLTQSRDVMCCQEQSTNLYLIEGGTEEDKGVEGSSCVSVVHAFIAVFLIAKISQDLADAFYRHIVHEWCSITCVMLCCVVFRHVMLCCVVCCVVLRYVMLCCVMLSYVMS
jgi:hypothetical protein